MQFICFISARRPTFPDDATEEELAVVGAHFQYLVALKDKGKLILAGRTQDESPIGLSIFEVESQEEAEALVANDPAVKAGIFKPTLRPYQVAVAR
jgi:uncharacterized protein YciI